MDQTTEATTTKKLGNKWTAFVMINGTARVLTAKYQKDIKRQLNTLGDAEVLSIVRGKIFNTAVVKTFDIVETHHDSDCL